jgi:PIN domain nuclease of toxin-antitoxin system
MKRPILLDTCAALWIVADEVSAVSIEALAESLRVGLPVYVSPITAWEIGNLARKGRFKSNLSPMQWFEVLMSTPNTKLAELTPKLLLESAFLPGDLPKDPADRIIAATAREYGFTVMTRDRALLAYAKEGYLSAMEC